MPGHDLVVIGAGPGGYVAAIRAAQLGLNVAIIEKEKMLGGTCLRVGCIPSKTLLESSERYWEATNALEVHGVKIGKVELDLNAMQQRKDEVVERLASGVASLMKKNKITRHEGRGRLIGSGRVAVERDSDTDELKASHILIATGSKPTRLAGVEYDGERIGTSTEALGYAEVPERLVVIGAGYIGLEMGSVWRRLGAHVTIVEYRDRILPGMDAELAKDALRLFKRQGFQFHLNSRVTGARVDGERCIVERENDDPFECDRVLVATGRVPNTEGLGLESVGIKLDRQGGIPVDDRFSTDVDGIYAIGDVIRGPMLAHKAQEEGVACVEHIHSDAGHVNYNAIPAVVYTQPEIATVGKTEEQLEEASVTYRKGVFQFRRNGRARALGLLDGKLKVLADARTDRVLGVHIIGARAGDLIAEAAAAIEFGASSEDLARCCHAHPTLAEVLKEAALAVNDRAIHG